MIATAPPAPATRSPWADVPFGEFLHLLRRNGFAVGLQHYARMMTLLDTLGPECSPDRVRSMLAPVFATTPDQQDRFYRLFDQWFPIFVSGTAAGLRRAGVEGEAADGDAAMPTPGSRRGVRRKRRLLPALAGLASAVLLTLLVWWVMQGTPPAPASIEVSTPAAPGPSTPAPTPQVTPVPTPPPAGTAPERQINWRAVRAGAALLIVLGFVLNEWRHYRRRRMVVERQRRERPPLVWPIRVDAASTPLVESSEFLTAARRLRERQTGERERLDIEATISATIRALGRPVLHYVKETRPPEYLILIERASIRDHQARLFQHLIEHLAAEGVHASVYWCEEDPRICDPVGEGPTATLMELRHKFPSHRLLMFGSGDGLIDPITGRRKAWVSETLSWPDRALLTPESPESWGARELALAGHMVVLPGSLAGLQAAIDHFQLPSRRDLVGRRQRLTVVPEPNAKDAVREIRNYLGPRGLQWVCACAVYPDLQWRLTLHLGMLPELGGSIDEETLVKLVRLSWFRQGAIPDEARAVLLRVIEPDVERAARRTIIALLERNPAPPETIASSRFELDLVVQKFALNTKARAHRRELAKVARHAPRERVLSELAVLRLTESDPTSTVAMRLPERLRDIFFQGGVSVLGLTSGARSVVAVALVAGVLFIGSRPADATGSDLVDAGQDSATVPEPTSLPRREITAPDSVRDIAAAPPPTTAPNVASADSTQRAANSVASRASNITAAPPSPLGAAVQPARPSDAARVPDSVRTDSSLPPARPADRPRRGVVIVGSTTPNATLYFESESNGPLGAARAYLLPAGEPVRLSIRADGCTPFETTVTVGAGDTTRIGMTTLQCSPVAVDSATVRRLMQDAARLINEMLGGRWIGVDKAPLSFANTQQQQRFASVLRDYQPVNGIVTGTNFQVNGTPYGTPAVTKDSVFLSGTMRFEWRSFVGTVQRSDATFEAAFARSASAVELRRILMNIRGLP